MKYYTFFPATLLGLVVFVFLSPVQARSLQPLASPVNNIQDREQQRQELIERQQMLAEQRQKEEQEQICKVVTERLQTRNRVYARSHEQYQSRYQHAITKISETVTSLKGKGCDTSQVEADLGTLQTKLNEFTASYNTMTQTLNQVQTEACSADNPGFNQSREQISTQLQAQRGKAQELITFYNRSLRPHLIELRNTCRETIQQGLQEAQ